jgi:hypothetical protein
MFSSAQVPSHLVRAGATLDGKNKGGGGIHDIFVFVPEKRCITAKFGIVRLEDGHARDHPAGSESIIRPLVAVRDEFRLCPEARPLGNVGNRVCPGHVGKAVQFVFRARDGVHLRGEARS